MMMAAMMMGLVVKDVLGFELPLGQKSKKYKGTRDGRTNVRIAECRMRCSIEAGGQPGT